MKNPYNKEHTVPKKNKKNKTKIVAAKRLAPDDVIKFGGNDYLVIDAGTSMLETHRTSVYAAGFSTLTPGARKSVGDRDVLRFAVPHDTPFTVLK